MQYACLRRVKLDRASEKDRGGGKVAVDFHCAPPESHGCNGVVGVDSQRAVV